MIWKRESTFFPILPIPNTSNPKTKVSPDGAEGKQPVPRARALPLQAAEGAGSSLSPPPPQPLLLLSARRSGSTFWKPVTA